MMAYFGLARSIFSAKLVDEYCGTLEMSNTTSRAVVINGLRIFAILIIYPPISFQSESYSRP